MSRWTSVVSYHTDPETCGVAKFSKQLAERLGVPLIPANDLDLVQLVNNDECPLLSIKWSEWVRFPERLACCDQLWHDDPGEWVARQVTGRVWRLYEIGVPALVQPVHMDSLSLFTFGMAHKLELDMFRELVAIFPTQELWISTATHEGAGPSKVSDLMRLWGRRARNLGHLSDAALALVWPHVLAFVAFFEGGVRPNNSSVHAALNAGVQVITNWGPGTPDDLKAVTNDYRNIPDRLLLRSDPSPYTWDRLLKELGCDASR
jgi:hypothetical protein